MIKKMLLTATAVSMLASTTTYGAGEGDVYAKLSGGIGMLNTKNKAFTRSSVNGLVSAAAGYYIMDNIRAEVAAEHLLNTSFKNKDDIKDFGSFKNQKADLSRKSTAILAKAYLDMPVNDMFTVYVGAGAGMSRNSDTVKVKGDYSVAGANNTTTTYKVTGKTEFKSSNSFAFGGYVGVAAEVSEGVFIDLEGAYNSYGKSGKNKESVLSAKDKDGKAVTEATLNQIKTSIDTQNAAADVQNSTTPESPFSKEEKNITTLDSLSGFSVRAGVRFIF